MDEPRVQRYMQRTPVDSRCWMAPAQSGGHRRRTDGPVVRACLRESREEERIPFPDLETLALYLLNLPEHPHRTPGTAAVTPRVFTSGFEAGGDERSGS